MQGTLPAWMLISGTVKFCHLNDSWKEIEDDFRLKFYLPDGQQLSRPGYARLLKREIKW
ncbi:hypothetical protein DFR30_0623 [Thiogranum longum]|uniref:Uncharacterized protein n=1 Tax=Thiogranum longum TaxID=1537524 RepID=A0A4R1HA67_9GAMM|nr:hypothetical protein DFR30_0623 [Thiogranum longum]